MKITYIAKSWNKNYQELSKFVKRQGHFPNCRDPFSTWIRYQRERFRGKKGNLLTSEQLNLLNKLPGDWLSPGRIPKYTPMNNEILAKSDDEEILPKQEPIKQEPIWESMSKIRNADDLQRYLRTLTPSDVRFLSLPKTPKSIDFANKILRPHLFSPITPLIKRQCPPPPDYFRFSSKLINSPSPSHSHSRAPISLKDLDKYLNDETDWELFHEKEIDVSFIEFNEKELHKSLEEWFENI